MTEPNTRRIQRVRHEIHRRELPIVRIETLSPNFLAITFGGESLANFVSLGFDDHVKFVFTTADGTEVRRDYTPRHFDPVRQELTLEFALHEHGQAAQWARQAKLGDTATIAGPRGSMVVPHDFAWHLLVGDATALPAILRCLEELPTGAQALVTLLVDPADRRPLHSAANLTLNWVDTPEDLLQALRQQTLPEGEGFAWGSGEASLMTQVRDILIVEKQHPKEAMRVAAYWRRGAAGVHEELTPA